MRHDWDHYQDVRHFLAAKRALRHPIDAALDQLAAFKLWADVGALAVEALTDDAAEFYLRFARLSYGGEISP